MPDEDDQGSGSSDDRAVGEPDDTTDAGVWERLASETEPLADEQAAARADDASDGVRILGAQTAAEASGAHVAIPADEPADAAPTDQDEDWREVRYPAAGPSWSATDDEPSEGAEPDVGGASSSPAGELPHWSEPPTAEMAALGAVAEDDEHDEVWATFAEGQPRFRSEESDWAEADFGEVETAPEPDTRSAPDEFLATEPTRRRGGSRRTATTEPPAGPAEPDHPVVSGRDLPTALATAGIVAVLALLAFSAGTFTTALLASLVVGAATLEFATGLRAGGFRPAVPIALVGGLTLPLAAREYGPSALIIYTLVVAVFSMLWFLWRVTPGRPIGGIASTMFAFGYVGFLGGFAGLLLAAEHGIGLILGAVICTVAYDVAGFFFGSQFGRTPIAPAVSPHKTVEGTVAGMLASVLFGWLVVGQIYPWNGSKGLVLGVLIAVGAFLGDLSESLIKRDLRIKDFGTLLPGHGGVLDRFDGLLFALPITYYLAIQFNILF